MKEWEEILEKKINESDAGVVQIDVANKNTIGDNPELRKILEKLLPQRR